MRTLSAFLALAALGIGSATAAPAANAARPNVLILLADDMGFSDLGCYGGEIQTPNLDGLAADGLRYTDFHNTSRCCPSRASLLTGLYSHQAGVGHMTFRDGDLPGYQGQLNANTPTIAEVLKTAGYQTAMAGKWHVSRTTELPGHLKNLNNQVIRQTFADLTSYPLNRGFERYFGIIGGWRTILIPSAWWTAPTPWPPCRRGFI